MPKMKQIVIRYLTCITVFIVLVVLIVTLLLQILTEQRNARISSEASFYQIEHILEENQNELTEARAEYSQSCLYNAQSIAYMIQSDPTVLDSIEEIQKIARLVEVDEIHIFDTAGCIVNGTHPEYYGFTFDSGEQIGFFKPMLEDKELKLVQDITANTAENKLMQYSAVWSENGNFIVQVGMEPVNVMKVTKKNELSYIFSLLRANAGVNLYAIDKGSGEIMGSTITDDVGKHLTDIGFDMQKIEHKMDGFHAIINGSHCYCIFTEVGDNLIGRVVSSDVLYEDIPMKLVELLLCLIVAAVIQIISVMRYMNKYVINGIYDINSKLRAISGGKLDEKADVRSSLEFSELSNHINEMIRSLLSSTDKISFVLNKTNLRIGVYEYNENMRHVRFTEYIPGILGTDRDATKRLASDYRLFKEHLDLLRKHPLPEEKGVYCIPGETVHYVKLEEIVRGNDILGIIVDVTEEVQKRRQIETERDIDLLTGLYNRRGLEGRLAALFAAPDKLGHGAMIMIDADGLKSINDRYGHEKGDIYLQSIASAIRSVGKNASVCARQGGDEFVLFLYDYADEVSLMEDLHALEEIQNHHTAALSSDLSVPLRFSFGYSLTRGEEHYPILLQQADEKMYACKMKRKEKMN